MKYVSKRFGLTAAALAIAVAGESAAKASPTLTLQSGTGPTTLANTYGFAGKYYYNGSLTTFTSNGTGGGGAVSILFVLNADNSFSVYTDSNAGPYDGNDDAQIGILNKSSATLNSITLSAKTLNIYGFDGDGIGSSTYGAPTNTMDTSSGKYGGPISYFTGINAAQTSGTVNFLGGIAANGGYTYFSLEHPPSSLTGDSITPGMAAPEPSTLISGGIGCLAGLGFAWRRRKAKLAA